MFSANELLDMAVKLEKNGEAVYRRAIDMVSTPELVSLLEWMADEEKRHADIFSEMKRNLETKQANPFMEEMSQELFGDLLGDKNFSLKEVDFSSIETSDELLTIFIEFENDSVIFYKVLEPFVVDPVALEYLRDIIDEETRHINQLQDCLGRKEALRMIHD